MKRTMLFFAVFLSLIAIKAFADETPKAYYVYQHDGSINAFFYDEVDSMVYSRIDIDSVLCDKYVTQEIWTPDTVVRIPIAAIDSIGLQTPQTIYKEGVTVLDKELLDYVISVDSLTIYFSKDIPQNIMPHRGDKLFFTSMTSLFPNGFSGTVSSTSFSNENYVVECSETPIEDMVEQYYAVRSFYAYDSDETANARRTIGVDWYYDNTIKLGDWKYDIDLAAIQTSINFFNFGKEHLKDYERVNFSNASYSLTGSAEKLRFYGRVRPSLRINSCFIINKELGKTFILSINGKWNHQHSMDLKGSLDLSIDIPFKPLTNAWNLGAAYKVPLGDGFFVYFKPGLSVGAEGSLEYEQSDESETNIYFFWRYDERNKQNQVKPQLVLKSTKKSIAPTKISGSLKGHCGFFLEVGLTFIDEIFAKFGWRGEAGVSIEYDATLYKDDFSQQGRSTISYEKLADNAVVWKGYRSGAIDLKFAWFPFSISLGKTEKEWERKSFVPTFGNLSLGTDSETKKQLTTDISGNIFGSLLVGTKIYDEDSESSVTKYFDKEFDRTSPFSKYTIDFSDYLKPNHKYTAYPVIKWNDSDVYLTDQELLATPATEFMLESSTATITNFEVLTSHHSPKAYYNDGKSYDYKFSCATTVQLDNIDNVEDWGYIYEDPYGNKAHISLKNMGQNPYTDTRYAYYRNEPESSVRLYGFVKYYNDDEYYYGEVQDFELHYDGDAFSLSKKGAYYYDNWGNSYVNFEYELNVKPTIISGMSNWGAYIEEADGNCLYFPAGSDNGIHINYDVKKTAFDLLDKENCIATKKVKLGLYEKNGTENNLLEPEEYEFVYDTPINLRMTGAEITDTVQASFDERYWTIWFSYNYHVEGALFIDNLKIHHLRVWPPTTYDPEYYFWNDESSCWINDGNGASVWGWNYPKDYYGKEPRNPAYATVYLYMEATSNDRTILSSNHIVSYDDYGVQFILTEGESPYTQETKLHTSRKRLKKDCPVLRE